MEHVRRWEEGYESGHVAITTIRICKAFLRRGIRVSISNAIIAGGEHQRDTSDT